MAKVFIANRPVRFDRNYKIGEVVPDSVVTPGMGRKLVEMGRLLHVELPDADTGEGEAGAFACAVCGRTFATQNALAAHSRAHKEQT